MDVPTLARSGSSTLKPATGLWAGMALSMVMVPVGAVTVGLSLVGASKMVKRDGVMAVPCTKAVLSLAPKSPSLTAYSKKSAWFSMPLCVY